MKTLVAALIVKDEAEVIGRSLESIKLITNKIVVIDTGSSDATPDIVLASGAHLDRFTWIEDFAAARNYSFEVAEKIFPEADYIIWLDADDVILEEDAQKIKKLLENADKDAYMFQYAYSHDERGAPNDVFPRERMLRHNSGFRWEGFVHEAIEVKGDVENRTDIVIHQFAPKEKDESTIRPERNIRIFEHNIKKCGGVENISSRTLFYYAKELQSFQPERSEEMYLLFLKRNDGWWEDAAYAHFQLATLALLLRNDVPEARKRGFESVAVKHTMAEAYCVIGLTYVQEQNWAAAAHWYENAVKCESMRDQWTWGIRAMDWYTWIPHLQLCMCYYQLGMPDLAKKHNDIALSYRPNNEMLVWNSSFFNEIGVG